MIRSTVFPGRYFLLAGVVCLGSCLCACKEDPERPLPSVPSASIQAGSQSGKPEVPKGLLAKDKDAGADDADAAPPPHKGPWFVVTKTSTGVYTEPSFDKDKKFAYARNGGKLPVDGEVVSKNQCSGGWYKIVTGGFVCGNAGTIDEKSKKVEFVQHAPDLDDVLPYKYARNAKNGTPLYRSIPSRDQMLEYEPYLLGGDEKSADKSTKTDKRVAKKDTSASERDGEKKGKSADDGEPRRRSATIRSARGTNAMRASLDPIDAGVDADGEQDAEEAPSEPWWKNDEAKERLHELTIEDLSSEADGILAKRMVKGFYVAIDKTFRWNGRTWYRTTKGLVAPADRFWQTKGSDFKGVELGDEYKLPVGWVYGGYKSATTYAIDEDANTITPKGSVKRFTAIKLSGETKKYRGTDYRQTSDGLWIKSRTLRVTEPGDLPEAMKPGETWVDVNLSQQTLVAFRGETPIYATLVSSGKKSSIKEKDHRTPTGEWRIRVKHITDTMDGDGTAAGDLPYSIEDVPYVMYFHRSYALHGAFWHANYGVQMSHGCVNLAPLDAKHLFFILGPNLPAGAHGVWSTEPLQGSIVKVHN